MIYIRSLIFNICCYSLILTGSVVSSLLGFFVPQKAIYLMWNDFFLVLLRKLLKWICGLDIEIRGAEHIQKGAAIYTCKHQSAIETYLLTSYIKNATYIFKKELTHIPFFGWAVHFYGSVPVDRSGGSRAMKNMLSEAKKLLNRDRAIIIFPEGTRVKEGMSTLPPAARPCRCPSSGRRLASAVVAGRLAQGRARRSTAMTRRHSSVEPRGCRPRGVSAWGTKGPAPHMATRMSRTSRMSSTRLSGRWPGTPTMKPEPTS